MQAINLGNIYNIYVIICILSVHIYTYIYMQICNMNIELIICMEFTDNPLKK